MNRIIQLLVNGFAVYVTAYLLPGVQVSDFLNAIITAIVLGIINTLIRPFIKLLTLPINILTLGLFTFVINAFLVLVASWLVSGFSVDGFLWALAFSLVLTLVNGFLNQLTK